MEIAGSSALVAGGASGLGEASVRALHERGAVVTIADVNAEKAGALADELGLEFVSCDVREEEQVQAAVSRRQPSAAACASRSAARAPAGRRRSPAPRVRTR